MRGTTVRPIIGPSEELERTQAVTTTGEVSGSDVSEELERTQAVATTGEVSGSDASEELERTQAVADDTTTTTGEVSASVTSEELERTQAVADDTTAMTGKVPGLVALEELERTQAVADDTTTTTGEVSGSDAPSDSAKTDTSPVPGLGPLSLPCPCTSEDVPKIDGPVIKGKWTEAELSALDIAYEVFGYDFRKISEFIQSRTAKQIGDKLYKGIELGLIPDRKNKSRIPRTKKRPKAQTSSSKTKRKRQEVKKGEKVQSNLSLPHDPSIYAHLYQQSPSGYKLLHSFHREDASSEPQVMEFLRGGTVVVYLNFLDQSKQETLEKEIANCKILNVYPVQGGKEPRVHALFHENGTNDPDQVRHLSSDKNRRLQLLYTLFSLKKTFLSLTVFPKVCPWIRLSWHLNESKATERVISRGESFKRSRGEA